MKPADHKHREQALDPNASFAVSAPAGSGKTGLLTQRVLKLLLTCEHPEEILAITFTRKAAGEMRERIIQALQNAALAPRPDDEHAANTWDLARAVLKHDQQHQWSLLDNPNRLRLLTIDGLCRQLARQLPFESGLGSLPEPVEQPQPLYRKAVRNLFQLLETDHPLADDLALILTELDNRYSTFETLLVNLLANRDQWLSLALATGNPEARAPLEYNIRSIISKKIQQLRNKLVCIEDSLIPLARYSAENLEAEGISTRLSTFLALTQLPQADCSVEQLAECIEQYQALADLLTTKTHSWRSKLTKNEGFPTQRTPEISKAEASEAKAQMKALIATASEQPGLLDALTTVKQLPTPAYRDDQWQLLSALGRLLPRLVAELTLVFAEQGCSDFIDTAQAALRALGQFDQPSELALRLDYRIRHILIDEFQDTSAPQRELIELLTAGWSPGDGRTLFVVGDAMQSCYGFRNANVGIFLQARQGGIGEVALQPLDLTVNFRSQAGIVNWVNETFRQAFPDDDDIALGAVAYKNSQAAKPALATQAVKTTLLCATSGEEDSQWLNECEAEAVVARIQQLRADHPDQTIALLARSRPHLRASLRLLDQAGLRYQAAELDKLSDRMAVQDLVNLLRALLDPTDRISWLALLRAPWCGLDNAELLTIARFSGQLTLADGWPALIVNLQDGSLQQQLAEDTRARLARVWRVLQKVQDEWGRKSLRDTLEGCWRALGGPQTLRSSADMDNCKRLLQLVEAHTEAAGIRDWKEFEQAIEQLYAAPDALADPKLQVMTIHKSKGLEFDQVLIPGLQRRPRQSERELLLWLEQIDPQGQPQTLLSPISNFDESPLYQFIRQEKKARERAEATRLLYVGCTRAIKQLHLFATVREKDGELQAPAKESLLAAIWPMVQEQALILYPDPNEQGAKSSRPALEGSNYIARLPLHWQYTAPHNAGLLAAYRGRRSELEQDDLNRPEPALHDLDARIFGTELHRLIEHFILASRLPDEQSLAELRAPTQARLRAGCHSEPDRAWTQIETALLTMCSSETGRWLLDGSHAQSATELPLWRAGSGPASARQFVIDRTFIDQGVRWVVDFKSSQPESGQSSEAFLAQERERYAPQLANYARLCASLGPEPVKCALYFPLMDTFMPF